MKATAKIDIDFVEETVYDGEGFYKRVKPNVTVEPIGISGTVNEDFSKAIKAFNKRNKTKFKLKIG